MPGLCNPFNCNRLTVGSDESPNSTVTALIVRGSSFTVVAVFIAPYSLIANASQGGDSITQPTGDKG
ncbi:hypothetical protein CPB86DRAFT_789051 [Serendipita vermifera]|nr:hypothetical protein CPB86DRAFT_789051 [Serendipita vermifera]